MCGMSTKVPRELRRGHWILGTGVTESFHLWVLKNEAPTSAGAASTKRREIPLVPSITSYYGLQNNFQR